LVGVADIKMADGFARFFVIPNQLAQRLHKNKYILLIIWTSLPWATW